MPPLGDWRFRKPRAVPDDALVTNAGPHICPQAFPDWECEKLATFIRPRSDGEGTESAVHKETLEACRRSVAKLLRDSGQTEDCLFLDLFVPATLIDSLDGDPLRCGNALAPVVVTFGQHEHKFTSGMLSLMVSPRAQCRC